MYNFGQWTSNFEIAFMMCREWLAKVFGGGISFPTAPSYQEGYVK